MSAPDPQETPQTSPRQQGPGPVMPWEWIVLAAALAAGAAMRLWLLPRVPGLWMDEAWYGLDALALLHEREGWPLFFPANNGREPMFIYLLTFGLMIAGEASAIALRAVSACVGLATIPVVWLLAREFSGPRAAALAVVLFALLRWHVQFSCLAFRTVLSPLFAALVILFLLRAWRTGSNRDAALCGTFLGLGVYTYLSFRLMPVIVTVALLHRFLVLWREGPASAPALRTLIRQTGIIAGVTAVVVLPLAVHFARNPEHLTGRSGDISLWRQDRPVALLLRQARDVALMPLLRGDHVGKHNIPGSPRFLQLFPDNPERAEELWRLEHDAARATGTPSRDPHGTGLPVFGLLGGLLFYLGAGWFLWQSARGDSRAFLIVMWLGVGSLASILSFGAPNMLRLLFITPAVVLTVVQGITLIAERTGNGSRAVATGAALLVLIAATEIVRTTRWPSHPVVRQEFNAEWAHIGDFLRTQEDRLPVLLPYDPPPTLRFLAHGYRFNLPAEERGERWWEFRTVAPLMPLPETGGNPVPGGRKLDVIHPAGWLMGTLVETEEAESGTIDQEFLDSE